MEKKLKDMDDKEWARINHQACSFIHLCLAKVHKYSIMKETFTKNFVEHIEGQVYDKKSRKSTLFEEKIVSLLVSTRYVYE